MSIEELRRAIQDACRELTFAPAYLNTLAQHPDLADTYQADRLKCVADVMADLTESATGLAAMHDTIEELKAQLAEKDRQLDNLRELGTTALYTVHDNLKAKLAEKDAQLEEATAAVALLREQLAEKEAQIAADNNEILALREKLAQATTPNPKPEWVWVVRTLDRYIQGITRDEPAARAYVAARASMETLELSAFRLEDLPRK